MERSGLRALPVLAAAVLVAAGAAVGFGRVERPLVPSSARLASVAAGPASIAGAWKPASTTPTSYAVADAAGPEVHLYEAPNVPLADRPTMANPTWEGLPVVFLVLGRRGGWLHVQVSARPNGTTAWVSADEVTLRTVPNHIVVEVGARRVTVYHGDEALMRATVAVGTDRTPTPLGRFFVDGVVDVPYDTGPYGAFQVSVSGFSDVLQTFGGGVGQIALHGTNHPELLGQAVSNGCVRMDNAAITELVGLAPLGTPVEIRA